MKFTVERKALVKMLQCVGKKAPSQRRREKQVRLSACAARVFVEANQTTAGTEALVFEDGTCFLGQEVFLKILKTYKTKPNVTIEADARTLRFFSTTLPVTDYSHAATPPGKFQVFPVTDLTVLRPQSTNPPPALAPAPALAAKSPPAAPHKTGTFPISQNEMHLVPELIRLIRRLSSLSRIRPEHLAGLAHALFAIERLPRTTQGVDIELTLGVPSDAEDSYSLMLHISYTSLSIGASLGPGELPQIHYEVQSGGQRNLEPGDEVAWAQVTAWIEYFDTFLNQNSPRLRLSVADASAPDFMSQPSNKRNPPPPPSGR